MNGEKMKTHELKILPEYYEEVALYRKTFEIRRNDRDYQVGDKLILKEYYKGKYTGREVTRYVSYIYHGDGTYGLPEGFCVMSIKSSQPNVVLDNVTVNQYGKNCTSITNAGTLNLNL